MAEPSRARLLSDLLANAREDLDLELKSWLDLSTEEHKAVLAKALIAIANHGGGYVIVGLAEDEGVVKPADGRPPSLGVYSQDAINGIVRRYAEPVFHCGVAVEERDGQVYPIIIVQGGHAHPIRTKREQAGSRITNNTYYTRLPGPRSEAPTSGAEWDELIGRCVRNAREQLLDQIRSLLTGAGYSATESPSEEAEARQAEWVLEARQRWEAVARGEA